MKEKIQIFLEDNNIERILIHSDLMCGFDISFNKNRVEYLRQHILELERFGKFLWMPTFNYEFCGGIDYSVINSKSHVGVLSEYFRKSKAEWRTEIPVFSFSGTGELPNLKQDETIDPFGKESVFHYLYENNGAMMHYGSLFDSSTILHYVERISGKLLYRYDKEFKGRVITKNGLINTKSINYHVRPLNKHQEYDWDKLEKELIESNILYKFEEGRTRILLCNIKKLVDFWVEKMIEDPFYLLDYESKQWVKPMLDKLGRSFLISDFE